MRSSLTCVLKAHPYRKRPEIESATLIGRSGSVSTQLLHSCGAGLRYRSGQHLPRGARDPRPGRRAADGDRGPGAADRLLERGEPAAGQGQLAPQGDRDPALAGNGDNFDLMVVYLPGLDHFVHAFGESRGQGERWFRSEPRRRPRIWAPRSSSSTRWRRIPARSPSWRSRP